MSGQDTRDEVRREFGDVINMTASGFRKGLKTDESKSVGVTSGGQKKSSSQGSESVGHDSGEKIVTILGRKKSDLTAVNAA